MQGHAAPSIRRLLFDDLDVAQVLDEVAGDDLHAKDEAVGGVAQSVEEGDGGNGDNEATGRRVQRLGNRHGEGRNLNALDSDGGERQNHALHRTEQTEHRGERGADGNPVEALHHLLDFDVCGGADGLVNHIEAFLDVGEAGLQNLGHGGGIVVADLNGAHDVALIHRLLDLIGEALGHHLGGTDEDEAVNDEVGREDAGGKEGEPQHNAQPAGTHDNVPEGRFLGRRGLLVGILGLGGGGRLILSVDGTCGENRAEHKGGDRQSHHHLLHCFFLGWIGKEVGVGSGITYGPRGSWGTRP